MPSDLLGNVLGALLVDCEPQPRAAVLASRIHEAVQASVTNHFDYFSSHRFYYRHGGMRRSWRIVPRGIDPIRGTINISNWCRFGVYDILFEGTSPSLFTIIDSLPIPWMAAIIEGPVGQGHVFSAVLPRAIVRALTRPEQLRDLHRYRPADDSHAKTVLQNYPFMY